MTVVELWRRGQAGWPRHFPLVQFPNPPLLLALAARPAMRVCACDGRAADAAHSVFALGVGVWAAEELTSGANWFRRLLGLAGLAWVVRLVVAACAAQAPSVDDATVPGSDIGVGLDGRRGTLG